MYKRFYQLTANPFRLAPDPDFCFSHSGYTRAREYLEYALDQGEGFVMVTGRPGTGKTLLVETFLSEADSSKVIARRIAVSNFGAEDLLTAVAFAYGIDATGLDKGTIRHRIQQYFVQQERAGRRVLLIIDEAQALQHAALEELRILADLQTRSRLMLQLFLVGQESLQDLMRTPDMEQFQQRVIANYHLMPLSLTDVRAYIEYRLLQAGWSGNPAFTGAAVLSIYQLSKGVPRHINKICNRLLLLGFGKGSHTFDREDVREISAEMHLEQLTPLETEQLPSADPAGITVIPEVRDGLVAISDLEIRADKQTDCAPTLVEVSRWKPDTVVATSDQWDVSDMPETAVHRAGNHAARQNRSAHFKWRGALLVVVALLAISTILVSALPSILDGLVARGTQLLSYRHQPRESLDRAADRAYAQSGEEVADDEALLATVKQADVEYGAPAAGVDRPELEKRRPQVETVAADETVAAATVATVTAADRAATAQQEEIERLLSLGRQAKDDFRLVTPPGDNAYDYLLDVLRLDPANAEAQAGIQEIVDLYIALAGNAAERHEYDIAVQYLSRALGIQPDNPALLAMKEDMDSKQYPASVPQVAATAGEPPGRESMMLRNNDFLIKRQAEGRRRVVSVPADLGG